MQSSTNPIDISTCFVTLALGAQYRALAQLLARDLEMHVPNMSLVVLTDRVQVSIGIKVFIIAITTKGLLSQKHCRCMLTAFS